MACWRGFLTGTYTMPTGTPLTSVGGRIGARGRMPRVVGAGVRAKGPMGGREGPSDLSRVVLRPLYLTAPCPWAGGSGVGGDFPLRIIRGRFLV